MEEKEFQAVLAQKLRALIAKTGTKKKELAESIGVNNSFIGGILNEREKASTYRLDQMLVHMGKPSILDLIDRMIQDEPEKKTLKLTLKSQPSHSPQLTA